jgi:hypothetical protein
MAKFYLINNVIVGASRFLAGTLLDDTLDPVASVITAGGVVLPSTNAVVAAAAVKALEAKLKGAAEIDLQSIMQSAVMAETEGAIMLHKSVVVDFAPSADNFAALGAGVKVFTKKLTGGAADALPANARYAGHSVGIQFTGFDDATHAACTAVLGSPSGTTSIMTTVNLAAGQTGFPKQGTLGAKAIFGFPLLAEVHNLVVTDAVDLNTLTAGKVQADLFYFVLA